jgi:glycerol-3-phosphate acyltransferase PlsX
MGERLDYAAYGGSIVMGVNGVLIKPHGRSNAKAIMNSVRVARAAAQENILSIFREDAVHAQAAAVASGRD